MTKTTTRPSPTTSDQVAQITPEEVAAALKDGPEGMLKLLEPAMRAHADDTNAQSQIDQQHEDNERKAVAESFREEMKALVEEMVSAGQVDEARKIVNNEAPVVATPQADGQNGRPELFKVATSKGAAHNPNAVGAALDGEGFTAYDFLAAAFHDHTRLADPQAQQAAGRVFNRIGEVVATYRGQDVADGGLLLSEDFRSEVLRHTLPNEIVRPRARVITTTSRTVKFPALADSDRTGKLFGGIQFYWDDAGDEIINSQAKQRFVEMEAMRLTAGFDVDNETLEDADAFISQFVELYPEAAAWAHDIAFLEGNGAKKPVGAFSSGNKSVVTVAKESGQAAGTFVYENALKMISQLLPGSFQNSIWLANQELIPEFGTMALNVGTGGSAIFVQSATDGMPMTLLGRPIVISEHMEPVGTKGDIALVDFRQYLIVDRQQLNVASSPHVKFRHNETTYRFLSRVGGRPWLDKPVTPRKGSKKLSPTVLLETR